ncbi:MAG TPA: DoxX-like family protein [Chitinophagaceae bacterium]|jgi:hypothetical protein|nr:DoxX-like family protein [Chitinophagaceae bacterium]
MTDTVTMFVRYFLFLIWFLNGFYCKLLNLVPRHELIVARILGTEHASLFTRLIGLAEIGMAVWVVSTYRSRLCAIVQVGVILVMNIIELIKARDLLLFGAGNIFLATGLIGLILWTEYISRTKLADG